MPEKIRILFVGESAPAGGTFFYSRNSNLYRQMRAAFESVVALDGGDFLERFKELGCYLDDLCLEPVNRLAKPERIARCVGSEPSMSQRLRDYKPETVVVIGKTYAAPSVRRALTSSGISASLFEVPFPDRPDQRVAFVEQTSTILRNC